MVQIAVKTGSLERNFKDITPNGERLRIAKGYLPMQADEANRWEENVFRTSIKNECALCWYHNWEKERFFGGRTCGPAACPIRNNQCWEKEGSSQPRKIPGTENPKATTREKKHNSFYSEQSPRQCKVR
jgi:hypothetical protein